jgi:hypothetical protein
MVYLLERLRGRRAPVRSLSYMVIPNKNRLFG